MGVGGWVGVAGGVSGGVGWVRGGVVRWWWWWWWWWWWRWWWWWWWESTGQGTVYFAAKATQTKSNAIEQTDIAGKLSAL